MSSTYISIFFVIWKGKYQVQVTQKRKLLLKKWRDLRMKLNWNVLHYMRVLDPKLSHDTIFTVCSHTFTLFWLIKNMLKWRKDSDTYLTTVCRHHWSRRSLPLQLMKVTVLAESYNYLSAFIVICLLQRCLILPFQVFLLY